MSDEFAEAHKAIKEGRASELQPDYSKLTAIEKEFWQMVTDARKCSDQVILEAALGLADLQASAEGCWASVVLKGEELLAKLHGKAVDYAIAHLSDAYNNTLQYGIIVRGPEEILAAHGDPVQPPPINGGGPPPPPPPPPPQGPGCPPFWIFCTSPDQTEAGCVPPLLLLPDGSTVTPQQYWDGAIGQFLPITGWALNCITPTTQDITPPTFTLPSGAGDLTSNPYPSSVPGQQPWGGLWTIVVRQGKMQATNPNYPQPGSPPVSPPPVSPPPVSPPPPGPQGTITTSTYPPSTACNPTACYPTGYPPTLTGETPLPVVMSPPPPPPPPPITQFGLPSSDLTTSIVQPSVTLSFCDQVFAMTAVFNSLGNSLLTSGSFPFDQLVSLGGGIIPLPSGLLQAYVSVAAGEYSNFLRGRVVSPCVDALRNVGVCDATVYINLMTCKQFFDYIEAIAYSADFALFADAHQNISTPGILEQFSGQSAETIAGEQDRIAIRSELRPYFVPLREILDYCIHQQCPSGLPSIPDCIETYLKGQITEPYLQCLIEMQNGRYDEWSKHVIARREQLKPDEIVRLWLREELDDTEVRDRLRNVGMIDGNDIDDKLSLSNEIPPITDLIRFYTRNIYNPAVQDRFNLDSGFTPAQIDPDGILEGWRKSHGISDEAMQAYWRAHWTVPSVSHMAELVQRNRPGRVDPSIEVTADDFDRVLRENDWLDFWRPRMLNLIYHPLTRIDSRRAYVAGSMTRADYVESLQDIGYSPGNANILAAFADTQRAHAVSSDKAIGYYEKGGLSRDEALGILTGKGFSVDEVNVALDKSEEDMTIQSQIKCVDGYAKRYASGDLTEQDFRQALIEIGLDAFQVENMISRACNVKTKAEKSETASTLCDWYSNALISVDDFASRLTLIGYNSDDVLNIISRCNQKLAEKVTRANEREAKKAARDAKNKALDAQKLRKQRLDAKRVFEELAGKIAVLNNMQPSDVATIIAEEIAKHEAQQAISPDDAYALFKAMSASLPKKGPIRIGAFVNDATVAYFRSTQVGYPAPPV